MPAAPATSLTPTAEPRDVATPVRLATLVGWLVIAVTALAVGQRTASLEELQSALSSGGVTQVTSTGALPAGSTGAGTQEVVWRDGVVLRRTEVAVVSSGEQPLRTDVPVVGRDAVPQLLQLAPDLQVRHGVVTQSSSQVWGWRLPSWVGPLWLFLVVMGLALVVSGPAPWRATRWGWFWLSLLPGGPVAFLVLSGPVPLLRAPRAVGRRLTGGWALAALLVVTALT